MIVGRNQGPALPDRQGSDGNVTETHKPLV